ncbi:unnamed protein product [Arctia plantaginis]|uniref:Uncharacterized protein n=1 Tax=Arctia plantaginis TaxID=874455 RepID=A0A8S1BEN3_ARCPL|nr:unnamed protein product [Arctia plantaginis]
MCYFPSLLLIPSSEAVENSHRNRRALAFLNSTRFFLKFNFKENMIPWNQLFAQAIGFRMNWDVPSMTFRPFPLRLHRRNIYNYAETLLNKNGLSGFHCIRRTICEMQEIEQPIRIYHKILQMIFRKQSSGTERWHNVTTNECVEAVSSCPFSLLDISPYTDIS